MVSTLFLISLIFLAAGLLLLIWPGEQPDKNARRRKVKNDLPYWMDKRGY